MWSEKIQDHKPMGSYLVVKPRKHFQKPYGEWNKAE